MPTTIVTLSLDTKGMKGFFAKQTAQSKAVQDGISMSTQAAAVQIMTRMSAVLMAKHSFRVGVTDAASRNLQTRFISAGGTRVSFAIEEGDGTPANQFIRTGYGGSKAPAVDAIVDWINKKPGMRNTVYTYDRRNKETRKIRYTKFGGPRSNIRRLPGNVFRKDEQLLRQAAFLMARKIKGDRGGQHFKQLMPVGSPWFDYPRYVVKRGGDSVFQTPTVNQHLADGLMMIVEYLRTDARSKTIVKDVVSVDAAYASMFFRGKTVRF